MYFPILRGKQFELIALRELAKIVDPSKITPVIEPVRKNLNPLIKTIAALKEANILCRVIINPSIGDYNDGDNHNLAAQLNELLENDQAFVPVVSTKNLEKAQIQEIVAEVGKCSLYFEGGFQSGLEDTLAEMNEVLVLGNYPKKAFRTAKNIVEIDDNFKAQDRNADYPPKSFYSDSHTEDFPVNNLVGFGDYTIMTKKYSDSGGPAYVVALHLSYIEEQEYDSMYVQHFKSDSDSTLPVRTGAKFSEALRKLKLFAEEHDGKLHQSTGLRSFMELDAFPGLGQVKKYSIKHHIETLDAYLRD